MMTRGEFDKLVERYRCGECTPEEIAFVEQWMKQNVNIEEDEATAFEQNSEIANTEEELWENIRLTAGLTSKRQNWWNKNRQYVAAAAACLLLLVGTGLLTQSLLSTKDSNQISDKQSTNGSSETFNNSGVQQRIILSDSSVVILGEGAGIAIDKDYGLQTRTVKLKGEAFFDVKPNSKIPFLVFTGDLVTEVLGTSFTIKPTGPSGTIEVSVATGKVSVYSNKKDPNQRRRGVIITPNQKAVYDATSKSIRQDLVDDPKMVDTSIPKSVFNFDDATIGLVVSTLRHSYGMEIVVSNDELNNCIFTGDLSGFDLFRQLDYVCDIIGSQYEVRGTTIFLTGQGCANP